MKRIVLLFMAFPSCISAQFLRLPFTETKTAISLNPFTLAEIDYTIMAGFEYRLACKLYMSHEAGYIFASRYVADGESNSNGTGFIIRPSVKWFVSENDRFYLQPQVFYKQVTHTMYDWVGKNPVNGVPAYEQLQDFKYRRKITGFNMVAGFVSPIDRKAKGFIDVYFGLGVRNKKSLVVEPNMVYERQVGIFNPTDDGVFPSVPMGLRIIYVIN